LNRILPPTAPRPHHPERGPCTAHRFIEDQQARLGAAGVMLERLVPNGKGQLLQGNIHIVSPGGGSMGPMRCGSDEFGHVLEGRLELRIDDNVQELGPGDSFSFPSNLAHS
jgi:uncharacterized cupin superfamily protein